MKIKSNIYNVKLFRRLLGFVNEHKLIFLFSLISVFGLSIFGALRPLILQKIVDENLTEFAPENFLTYIFIMLTLLTLEVISNYSFIYNAGLLGQSIVFDIRIRLFEKIQNFRVEYFNKSSVGVLITRAVSDMERIADIFGQGLFMIISDLMKMLFVSILLIVFV